MHVAPVQRTILSTRRIMVPPLTLCVYMKKGPNLRWSLIQCSGGDEGDRTPDLLTASQALSQLSYAPVRRVLYGNSDGDARTILENILRAAARERSPAADAGAGTGREAPRCPFRPRGAPRGRRGRRPLTGALGTSRVPRTAVFRFRGAGRHPPNGHPAGAGPIIGANRAPARPAISKPCRFTGPGREPPGMP